MRISSEQAAQVVNLLVEGVGIRAISRLTRLNKETVLNVLETAGAACARVLDEKIRDVECESVQADELWSFVYCKNVNNKSRDPEHGDAYTFLGIDRNSKLILSHLVGKRDRGCASEFAEDLRVRIKGRTQLTTDQFQGYLNAVLDAFGSEVDFSQQHKSFAPDNNGSSNFTARRYSPPKISMLKTKIHIGNPNRDLISTSHVERTNLTVRLFNRRFTRLTLGYSKKLANLKHSVAILIAHFNFCRVHSAHKLTPAVAAGIADHTWTIDELLLNGLNQHA